MLKMRSVVALDRFMLPLIYKSLVRSHLEYANTVWGPFNKVKHLSADRVQ